MDGNFNEEEDTYRVLLDRLEAQNRSTVESLEAKGYELAPKEKRYVLLLNYLIILLIIAINVSPLKSSL